MSDVEWQTEVLAFQAASSSGREQLERTMALGDLLIEAYGWQPKWAHEEAELLVAKFVRLIQRGQEHSFVGRRAH